MPRAAIVDTGPLVAFLDRGERDHAWTVEQVQSLDVPLLVCEPVLAEAMYLLSGQPKARDALYGLLAGGALRIGFQVNEHVVALRALQRKYRDRPISLADAPGGHPNSPTCGHPKFPHPEDVKRRPNPGV